MSTSCTAGRRAGHPGSGPACVSRRPPQAARPQAFDTECVEYAPRPSHGAGGSARYTRMGPGPGPGPGPGRQQVPYAAGAAVREGPVRRGAGGRQAGSGGERAPPRAAPRARPPATQAAPPESESPPVGGPGAELRLQVARGLTGSGPSRVARTSAAAKVRPVGPWRASGHGRPRGAPGRNRPPPPRRAAPGGDTCVAICTDSKEGLEMVCGSVSVSHRPRETGAAARVCIGKEPELRGHGDSRCVLVCSSGSPLDKDRTCADSERARVGRGGLRGVGHRDYSDSDHSSRAGPRTTCRPAASVIVSIR